MTLNWYKNHAGNLMAKRQLLSKKFQTVVIKFRGDDRLYKWALCVNGAQWDCYMTLPEAQKEAENWM
jgi:hypothetical protein